MFKIDKETMVIKLTRGDSAEMDLDVEIEVGEDEWVPYDCSDDFIEFTVKKNTITQDIVLHKIFQGGTIELEPADTKDLAYQIFRYDVQLITPNGKVYTIIEPTDFNLTDEVNFNVTKPVEGKTDPQTDS